MTSRRVKRTLDHVSELLYHPSPLVRHAAAQALGTARVGVIALRGALKTESIDLVVAEICESLRVMRDKKSIGTLSSTAENNASSLARMFALTAAWDLDRIAAESMLQRRWAKDRSFRVRAVAGTLLFLQGFLPSENLLRFFRRRDHTVHCSIPTLLVDFGPLNASPQDVRDLLGRALAEKGLGIAALDCIKRSLECYESLCKD